MAARAHRRGRGGRDALIFLGFAGPNLVLFAAFTFWPIVYSAWLSLNKWNFLPGTRRFAGLANYAALLRDPEFWRVVANTLAYAAAVVVVAQTLAFGLAMLLNARVRGRGVFRTLAFLPHVTATAAAALAFVLLLDPRFGPLAALYDAFGVDGPRWLSNGLLALAAMAMVGIWKEIGFASLFFLAGLQNLPRECHEAAVLDGASAWQRLRYVTVPLMSPVILFLLVTGTIAACKAFDVVAMMTEGGPVYPDSSTYVYHLYTTAFRRFEAGYASAMAVVFFVLMTGVAVAQFRIARRHVHYEG